MQPDKQSAGPPVGRRQIVTQNVTAQPDYEEVALTAADFLNPQPGDEFFHGEQHDVAVKRLAAILRHLCRYSPSTTVLAGAKIIWPDPTLPQPAPDLAVVSGVAEPQRPRQTFNVAEEGETPRFILEVTSPLLAEVDRIEKRALYAQAGVQEYFILDLVGNSPAIEDRQPDTRPALLAYRLEDGAYLPIAPDEQGRLYSAANKTWFVVNGSGVVQVIEARTGAPIEPPDETEEPQAAAQVEAAWRAQSIASKLDFLR